MGRGPKLGRGARWAVPAAAVLTVGAVVAGTTMAGAQASPDLPSRTAAQLLADVQQATGPGPLTATVQETANLGLPSLPGSSNSSSAMSLLSGTHSFNIWYLDPAHVRVAQPVQLGESDLRRDGRQVWLWNSKNQTATHVVLPSAAAGGSASDSPASPAPPPTPQNLARQILAAVGPTTTVSVQQNVSVAGQSAYQLAVAPKDSGSLIGRVTIAVDAHRYLPLRVQVFARGSSSPAFELGFTSLSFGQPAASNFAFTPPADAKVKTIQVPAKFRPGKSIGRHHHGWYAYSPRTGDRFFPGHHHGAGPVTVMGKGWLSVLVLSANRSPDSSTTTTTTSGSAPYSATLVTSPSSGVQGAAGPAGQGGHLAAQARAIARTLMREATPVSGSWGSGRLLRTSLVSVLITSKGTVYLGAVEPSVLYADAAASK